MEDIIYREDAINCLCNGKCLDEMRWCDDGYCPPVTRIKQLPSAQPERTKGKWIPHREKSREYIGTVLVSVSYDYWLCDACGYRVKKGQPMYNFCPNCGVDMRGEL